VLFCVPKFRNLFFRNKADHKTTTKQSENGKRENSDSPAPAEKNNKTNTVENKAEPVPTTDAKRNTVKQTESTSSKEKRTKTSADKTAAEKETKPAPAKRGKTKNKDE